MKTISHVIQTSLGALAFLALPHLAAAQDSHVMTSEDRFAEIRDSLQRIEDRIQTRSVKIRTKDWNWEELERFQSLMWKSMALDPARVPSSEVPTQLDPVILTQQMKKELAGLLRSRHVAEKYHAEDAFDDYVTLCQELIELREKDLYRKARVIAKKGELDQKYMSLVGTIASQASSQMELTVAWDKADRESIREGLTEVRNEFEEMKNPEMRQPASYSGETPQKGGSVKTLVWVLMPLFFLTGLVGGLSWNDENGKRRRREAEPKP